MSTIKIDNVTKKYGRNIALNSVSAEIESGRIYGLLGRNGAGKSTLLNIITNRVFATSGTCSIDGENLLDNDKALSRIYAMNEAVTMPASMNFKRCVNVTADFYKNFDKDYAFSLAEKFHLDPKKRLSALSSGADFLFFDEPVLGLDANHRDLFYRLLVERFADQNCGIVISTHLIEECQTLVENVIMINKGSIIASGTTDDILSGGYCVTGAQKTAQAYCRDKNVLSQRKMGTISSVYLKGSPENVPDSLEVSRPDLQQVFINLTGEEGEQ